MDNPGAKIQISTQNMNLLGLGPCLCQLPSFVFHHKHPKAAALQDGEWRRLPPECQASASQTALAEIRWDCEGEGSHHTCLCTADLPHIMARAPVCASGVEKVPTRVLPLTLALVLDTVSWLGTVTLEVWYPAS